MTLADILGELRALLRDIHPKKPKPTSTPITAATLGDLLRKDNSR